MAEPRIWTELLTYGLGVALSPIHIVLLLLLLLGARCCGAVAFLWAAGC